MPTPLHCIGGEADERASLDRIFAGVFSVTRALAGGLVRLTWITSSPGWLAIIVPFLMAAPGYFEGKLSFGSLVIVVGAFNQVLGSLRWQVENFSRIADWRATLSRAAAHRDWSQTYLLSAFGEHPLRCSRLGCRLEFRKTGSVF